MLTRLSNWARQNKLLLVVVAIFLGYLLLQRRETAYPMMESRSLDYGTTSSGMMGSAAPSLGIANMMPGIGKTASDTYMPVPQDVAPSQTANRMMVQNASLSLLVKDVQQTLDLMISLVSSQGGYVINRSVNRPTEQPYANASFRIPSDKFEDSLKQIKSLGLKVTYETITGTDVTDQFEDLDTQILQLRRALAQVQAIQDRAEDYSEISSGLSQMQSMQRQIDSLIGRQKYLEQTAKLSLVSVTLSTDELALPYAPDTNFRPALVYKQAVRSLVIFLQGLMANGIWIAVYAIVWIPISLIAAAIFMFISRKKQSRTLVK